MTGGQKVLLSLEMSAFDRKAKTRKEHLEWCEMEVMHEIFRQAFLPGKAPQWLENKWQNGSQPTALPSNRHHKRHSLLRAIL
jgi:hypothetical protein